MKKIIWILVLTVLVACSYQEKGIEVKIENKSDFPITEVEFYTSQKRKLERKCIGFCYMPQIC